MSSVKSLTVTGYKSIRELLNFQLTNLNVLIGANGAGKSNFIGLFRLLNEMYEQQLQVYVQTQGGPDALLHFGRKTTDRLHAEFYFARNGYKFDLIPTNDNRLIFEREISWFGGIYFDTTPSATLGTGHEESKLKDAKDRYPTSAHQSAIGVSITSMTQARKLGSSNATRRTTTCNSRLMQQTWLLI
jgi:energy-coupling factor transporter ATP-binding protein EcfA2